MKHPKLRTKKKLRLTNIRKTKQDLTEIVDDCLRDIRWYIVDDIIRYLKKRGLVNVNKKNKKKNKKKK